VLQPQLVASTRGQRQQRQPASQPAMSKAIDFCCPAMRAALALLLQPVVAAATSGVSAAEGSCCFGLTSCAEKASNPLNCPDISGCQTQSNCLGPCSSKQQARWCPSGPPAPPPPPFVPSVENITVYRITPQNYSGAPICVCMHAQDQPGGCSRLSCSPCKCAPPSAGVENMNTGDAAGDAFFGL
jgi:hypothetical protein